MRKAAQTDLAQRQTALALRSAAPSGALPCLSPQQQGGPMGAAGAAAASTAPGWDAVLIPEGFGLEVSSRLKWRQTQTHGRLLDVCCIGRLRVSARLSALHTLPVHPPSHAPTHHPPYTHAVEVFVRLPEALALQLAAGRSIKSKVAVVITPESLSVGLGPGSADAVVEGRLFARVKAEASTWFMGALFV